MTILLHAYACFSVEQTGKELKVFLADFELSMEPLPILWHNGGLYGMISKEKMQNMREALQDQEELPVLDKKSDVGKFYWDDCVVVPPKIARLLFGEKT